MPFCFKVGYSLGVTVASPCPFPPGLSLLVDLFQNSCPVSRYFPFPNACSSTASAKFFVFIFAERRCVFGMVGAVPVCPSERPRSGVSIPKNTRIMRWEWMMDAPLQGDTGGHTGTAPTKLHHAFLHHSIKQHHPSTCNPPMINGHFGHRQSIK